MRLLTDFSPWYSIICRLASIIVVEAIIQIQIIIIIILKLSLTTSTLVRTVAYIMLLVWLGSCNSIKLLDWLGINIRICDCIIINLIAFKILLIHLLIICSTRLLPFWILSWRILHHFIWLISSTSLSSRHAHLHSIITGTLPRDSLIRSGIYDLREISFSSNFLASAWVLLLRRLRINLLLLHRVILGAIIYGQLAAWNPILVGTNGLIMLLNATWSVWTHNILNLTLIIVESWDLDTRFISGFGPESINRALSSPLLSLRIFSTFTILLNGRNLNRIRPSIWLLRLLFLMIIRWPTSHSMWHDNLILTHGWVGPHCNSITSFTWS